MPSTLVREQQTDSSELRSALILGMRVDCTSYEDAARRIVEWAHTGRGGAVCAANVHMVMESYDNRDFQHAVNQADIVTSDGMPLVWGLKLLGHPDASRVYGPDLTLVLLEAAQREQLPIAFYGGSPEALERLQQFVAKRWPGIRVVCAISPPFRALTAAENSRYCEQLRLSGARLVFIGLGCPKQERWMQEHRDQLGGAVLLAVGAAFDFLTGAKPQAPRWMMRSGLEWLFRLVSEPARLWRRYLILNPRFVALFAMQLLLGRVPPAEKKQPPAPARMR